MNSSPLVSIVIPVYNVNEYLDECLDSVIRQSYKNIEIILVDDGSTDGSGVKCDTWAQSDKRIKVVHKENEGLNYARRDGFKKSSGEYITFLDSDDLFHEKNIELSLGEALDTRADIVSYTFTKFSDKDNAAKFTNGRLVPFEQRILDDKKEILEYIFLENGIFPGSHAVTAWGKLYKRAVVEPVDWTISNYRSYEDNLWTPQLFAAAKRVVLLSCPLSFYRRNDEYGVQGETLGNRLIGNTYNGSPIGYVELIDKSFDYYNKLAKNHKVDIEVSLYDKRYLYMKGRFDSLIDSELVDSENNLKYLGEVWRELSRRHAGLQDQNAELRRENTKLQDKNTELKNKNTKLQHLNTELTGSLSWRITRPLRAIKKAIQLLFK